MNLQQRLSEIQSHIDSFKEKLVDSEKRYQTSLRLITDFTLSSLLMERHVIYTERRRITIARMEELYGQVQDQLGSPDKYNL